MITFFIDTNIWNYLIDSQYYTENQLVQVKKMLINGIEDQRWEVVCSLTVCQEILATYSQNTQKFNDMCDLLFKFVGKHWILPFEERYILEFNRGRVLNSTERFLNRKRRKEIEKLIKNKINIININEIAHETRVYSKEQKETAKKNIYKELGSSDGKKLKNSGKLYEDWFRYNRNLSGWVYESLKQNVHSGLLKESQIKDFTLTKDNVPSLWQYFDFYQAKAKVILGEKQKILESDDVDNDIYGCNSYYDVLITEDKKFSKIISGLNVDVEFEVQNFKQFMQQFGVIN